jgi:CHAT domain-containing protein
MDEHIAACPDCYDVFSETLQFRLAEEENAGLIPSGRGAAVLAFVRRPGFKWAAALAAVAAIVPAILVSPSRSHRHAAAPLVADLVEAVGARRFVEPRLTGGFRYARRVVLRSGEPGQGLDAQPPAVLGAVAKIRGKAETDTSPEALGALAVTYLISGDVAAAVKALESASAQDPKNPRLLSDLAAAYLVRADRLDEPADIPKALEMAERAIVLPDPPTEAWFNRALALEKLHLVDAAKTAWNDYLRKDATSGWADEARQRLEALPRTRQSTIEEDRARVTTALETGRDAVERLADESPNVLRDYFDDVLLPTWAEAHLVGSPSTKAYIDQARLIGDALLRTTTDTMPRDAARALVEPGAGATLRDRLRSQAQGYRSLAEAKRLYDRQVSSCEPFREARVGLEAGASPYAAWARQQIVTNCLLHSQPKAATTELDSLETTTRALGYVELLGRVHWLQGLMHIYQGELAASTERYQSAREDFRTTRDGESEQTILALLGESYLQLGERRGAWKYRDQEFALLARVRTVRRRHLMLGEAAQTCVEERTPRAALHFGNAVVEEAQQRGTPTIVGEGLMLRASIRRALGEEDTALSDLLRARGAIARIGDRSWADRLQAEIDVAQAELEISERPDSAASRLSHALDYFQGAIPSRVPALHRMLARAQMAQGLSGAAEEHLEAGITVLERERMSLHDRAAQGSFFEQSLPLFDDMVRLQVDERHDSGRALAFVERAHSQQVADSIVGVEANLRDIEALQRALPAGLVLVYHLPLENRLLGWALTQNAYRFIERPLPALELSRLIAANRAAIEGRAPLDVVRQTAARLHDELVRPFIPFFASQRALVFVSDGILQSLAFASLWDRKTGHYLVEDYLLAAAPSGTLFLQASASAAVRPAGPRALVVGNPHFNRRLWPGLADLPAAESEAGDVAGLYPDAELLTGNKATKNAFLEACRRSQIVHYAGHATADADSPAAAHLLFSPDPRGGDSGALYLRTLEGKAFPVTRVVVLAACRTAAGPVSRVEGALSLARPSLAAGVPDVVAALWDIDDSTSHLFFMDFHRALLRDGDPVLALRTAQISLARSNDSSLSHPASWAAFISIGGLDPHSLLKGVVL